MPVLHAWRTVALRRTSLPSHPASVVNCARAASKVSAGAGAPLATAPVADAPLTSPVGVPGPETDNEATRGTPTNGAVTTPDAGAAVSVRSAMAALAVAGAAVALM
jgi:hypothetical protein